MNEMHFVPGYAVSAGTQSARQEGRKIPPSRGPAVGYRREAATHTTRNLPMKHEVASALWIALWGAVATAIVYDAACAGRYSLAAGVGLLAVAALSFFGRMALAEGAA